MFLNVLPVTGKYHLEVTADSGILHLSYPHCCHKIISKLTQNIAEYKKRKEIIILDMKIKLNSVGIMEDFDICGRRALAAIEPCISMTIRPEGGPPTIFDKGLTDFL